jgi:hypothetical protein
MGSILRGTHHAPRGRKRANEPIESQRGDRKRANEANNPLGLL